MSKWVYVALGAGALWLLFSGKKRREEDARRSVALSLGDRLNTEQAFRRLAQPTGGAPSGDGFVSRMAADLGIEV